MSKLVYPSAKNQLKVNQAALANARASIGFAILTIPTFTFFLFSGLWIVWVWRTLVSG
ncbi:MAG: hypothetical protein L6R45_20690 [Anaerolineae bacterium]|nr:hypothetical protein [Anaerolineae bacterium]